MNVLCGNQDRRAKMELYTCLLGLLATITPISSYVLLQVRKDENNQSKVDAIIHKVLPTGKFGDIASKMALNQLNNKSFSVSGHDKEDNIMLAFNTDTEEKAAPEAIDLKLKANNDAIIKSYVEDVKTNLRVGPRYPNTKPRRVYTPKEPNLRADTIKADTLRIDNINLGFDITKTEFDSAKSDFDKRKALREPKLNIDVINFETKPKKVYNNPKITVDNINFDVDPKTEILDEDKDDVVAHLEPEKWSDNLEKDTKRMVRRNRKYEPGVKKPFNLIGLVKKIFNDVKIEPHLRTKDPEVVKFNNGKTSMVFNINNKELEKLIQRAVTFFTKDNEDDLAK